MTSLSSASTTVTRTGHKKCYSNTFGCMVDEVDDIDAPGERALVILDDGLLVDMPATHLVLQEEKEDAAGALNRMGLLCDPAAATG